MITTTRKNIRVGETRPESRMDEEAWANYLGALADEMADWRRPLNVALGKVVNIPLWHAKYRQMMEVANDA